MKLGIVSLVAAAIAVPGLAAAQSGTPPDACTVATAAAVAQATEAVDKAAFEASMKTVPGGVKAVPGLGESAYFQQSTNQFFLYKGKTMVSLNYAGMGIPNDKIEGCEKALLEKIAKQI